MEISELTLKLIILLIPGAIACVIYEKITIHKKWNAFPFVANSILFGASSYIIAQLIFNLIGNDSTFDNFWSNLPTKEIPYKAVNKSSIIAVILSLICAALDYHKVLNNFAKRLKITNKYGDENLYSYFLNAKNVDEVYVRDIKNNITYHGIIDAFSETSEFKELVLRDVKVYSYDKSKFMYTIEKVYLSRPKDDIIIEVPIII